MFGTSRLPLGARALLFTRSPVPLIRRALLFTTAAVSGCGGSSGSTCNDNLDGPPAVVVRIAGDDGKPICDAYVTDDNGFPFCVRTTDCMCVRESASGYEPPGDQSRPLNLVVSRRGFQTAIVRTTLPPATSTGCGAYAAREFSLTMTAVADPGATCVPRDYTTTCHDHRTCYDGATLAGCTPTAETSLDPGASYACCK
jgi:hypothetical protein